MTSNVDFASLLAQALLFTAGTDLGYHMFIVANMKFISILVTAFRNQMPRGTLW